MMFNNIRCTCKRYKCENNRFNINRCEDCKNYYDNFYVRKPVKFLSSFIEALGSTQTVESDQNVAFDITELDVAGQDITVNNAGTIFTITKPGLYHVEWSLNLESAQVPVLVGLLENGLPTSALANQNTTGNYSDGALINVTRDDIPYTISLHNFGGEIVLADSTLAANTAASIRILRFADAAD